VAESAAEEITAGLGDYLPFSAPARQSGVSAPVFDDRGRVTMVLLLAGFSSELNESTRWRTPASDPGERTAASPSAIGGVSPSARQP